MAFDTVNVGTVANDGTGDTARAGMQKVNANFTKAVEGPATSVTADRLVVFDGTTGKLVKQDSKTAASLVEGPASATSGRIAVYNGTTGKLLQDGTKLEADVVTGPATATSGRIAVYNGGTGKILQDGTKLEADLVTGPASVTADRIALFDGTTGKLLKQDTKTAASLVEGPASVTTDRIAVFDGTTGKLLKQASVLVSDLLPLSGGTMTGAITTDKQIVTTVATLGTTGTLNIDMNASMLQTTGTLTGNITLTTSNRSAGETVTLRIVNGGTNRTITWPAGWKFVGTAPAAPETITANKVAIVTITAFGTADTDIVAAYAEQA